MMILRTVTVARFNTSAPTWSAQARWKRPLPRRLLTLTHHGAPY